MNVDQINEALKDVTFQDYSFFARESGGRMYIQAGFWALDHSKEYGFNFVEQQFTRKWYVSSEATKSEVIQTALKLVLTAAEHEVREEFKYRGKAVFGPHLDVDVLHAVCDMRAERIEQGVQFAPSEEEALVPG